MSPSDSESVNRLLQFLAKEGENMPTNIKNALDQLINLLLTISKQPLK